MNFDIVDLSTDTDSNFYIKKVAYLLDILKAVVKANGGPLSVKIIDLIESRNYEVTITRNPLNSTYTLDISDRPKRVREYANKLREIFESEGEVKIPVPEEFKEAVTEVFGASIYKD